MFKVLTLSIVILIVFSSCYPERKLAKTYIETQPDASILLLTTDYVFKNNLKIDEIGDTTGLTMVQIDSVLFENSLFLKDISDSVFLETFVNSMILELERFGFNVYAENFIDSFLFYQSPAYIFNVAQLLLEEHYLEHTDSDIIVGIEYFKTLNLNAVTFNTWFELSTIDTKGEGRKVFYVQETIADIVNGYFNEDLFSREVKYNYQLIEMDVDIIYRYCELLGRRYAGYLYDYLMNEYITQNFPDGKKHRFYMHYNRINNTLDPTYEDRFYLMEE